MLTGPWANALDGVDVSFAGAFVLAAALDLPLEPLSGSRTALRPPTVPDAEA